jgi:geranylgeranyl diphosphate synthase type I
MTAQPTSMALDAGPGTTGHRRSASEDAFASAVDLRLDAFLDQRCAVLLDVGPDLQPVAETIRGLAAGGKRFRATFCHWGWRGAGGVDESAVLDGAAALELFHLAALVHDDVMDHSDTRRGAPTAHEQFAGLHRAQRLDGDADDFGVGAALLIGDLCLTWSDELVAGTELAPERRSAVRHVYDLMRSQVVAGQYLDMLEQARPGSRRDASRRVLRYKSAKYTVEHPLLLGGAIAGMTDDLATAFSGYGVPVGEAFQLRDDVLGVFGDPDRTGKPVGDDLREGKKTLLVSEAIDRADDVQRRLLQRRLGDRAMTAAQVRQLQDVLVDTGALREVERRIERLTDDGVAAIRSSDVPEDVATGLADLALHIAGRSA